MTDKEELEAMKTLAKRRFPTDESAIDLIKTDDEMVDFLKEKREIEEGETIQQNDDKPEKTLGIVKHFHSIMEKPKEDEERLGEGGEDLSKTGGQIPLQNLGEKTQTWETHEAMLDDLFKLEMRGKIEKTKKKPDREIIEKGEKATSMIEKLYESGMKSGRLSRASKDLLRGRFEFEEPEWFRKLRNPEGRKKPKEKPVLVESL